jgi:hypothetical protein
MEQYSFQKGIVKGLISLLSIAGAFIAFTTFSDLTVWDLIVKYIQPLTAGLTVGGLITISVNYLKFRFL